MAEVENILITLVFFSIIMAAGAVFLTQMGSEYSHVVNLTGNYTATKQIEKLEALDVMDDIEENVRDMEEILRGKENSTGSIRLTEFGVLFISGIGSMFMLMFNSITIPFKLVSLFAEYLGIPMYARVGILTIILIVFIFIMGRIIFRREKSF